MSRAFVKEDDAGQAPIIPPRAALPAGMPNYVSPTGLSQLQQELSQLEEARARAETQRENDADRTRQLTILKGRIAALSERLSSAKVIDPKDQPQDEVRFGATIELKTLKGGKPGMKRKFQIVGVDEADIKAHKIAFIAPIAQAVNGAKLGETRLLKLGRTEESVEVVSIRY